MQKARGCSRSCRACSRPCARSPVWERRQSRPASLPQNPPPWSQTGPASPDAIIQGLHARGPPMSNRNDASRFDAARTIRAPRGATLNCKSWLTEAPYRMLQNNLDPDVAENPAELVVYGG